MKKSILPLAIIGLLLGAGALRMLFNGNTKSSQSENRDWEMAVDDLSSIHKIFFADRNGNTVTVKRNGDHWIYNNQYRARQTAVDMILDAVRRMRLKYRPSQAAISHMVEDIATKGIKVELYDKNDANLKTFYVGGSTADERGTHMMLDGSDNPYVMYIPSWEGNIRTRFFFGDKNWRDKTVFRENLEAIQRLAVEYPSKQDKSFIIEKTGTEYAVSPFYDTQTAITTPVNQETVAAYLEQYKSIGAEAFDNNNPKADSICAQTPFTTIAIANNKGEELSVSMYPLMVRDTAGQIIPNQKIERYMAKASTGDYYLTQQIVFGKILWAYDYFFEGGEAAANKN